MKTTHYSSESTIKHPLRLLRSMLHDLGASGHIARQLCLRDIKARYRQSLLGYLWALLPPLVASLPFIILNKSGVFNIGELAIPYAAYAMIGTTIWQLFADCVSAPIKMVNASKSILVKIQFPRESILLAAYGTVLFDFMVRCLILAVVFIVFKISPTLHILLLPIALLAIIALGAMIGIILTPIGVLYSDVLQSITILLSFWMLLTPVVYPPQQTGLLGILSEYNPISPLVVTARNWLIGNGTIPLESFTLIFVISILLLATGWVMFRISLPHLISRLGS